MALPSQTDRSGELGRTYQPAGNRSRTPLITAGVLVAAAGAFGVYYVATLIGGPKSSTANTPAVDTPGVSKEKPTPKGGNEIKPLADLPPSKPVDPPSVIRMGSEKNQPNPTNPPANSPPKPSPTPGPSTNPGTNPTPANPSTNPGTNPAPNPSTNPGTTPPATNPQNPTGPANPGATPGGAPNPGGDPGTINPGPVKADPSANPQGTNPTGPGAAIPATGSTSDVLTLIAEGDRKQKSNDLLGARAAWSKALLSPKIVASDAQSLRDKLGTLNADLVFSTKTYAGDPIAEEYTIEAGDGFQKIAKKRGLVTDWRLIERVNKMDSTKLKVGAKIKLVHGPFHAVVNKDDYRLDIFWGPPKSKDEWIFIKSYKVGLGPNTPSGDFVLKPGSRQVNPPWTNPLTGEKFGADDPKNPIGERWLGIQYEADPSKYKGFGIHGTIEPDSIGKSKSMGCIRLGSADVEVVYELLMDPVSRVILQP